MIRWGCITGLFVATFCLLAPAAHAAPLGKAVVTSCDKQLSTATFEGRITARRGTRMQLRFTLQALTPDEPRWRRIEAPGFGTWITAPAGVGRYSYDKTVEQLLAPASYRAVIEFRWKNSRGHVVHAEKSTSGACKQPDQRPDLAVRDVRYGARGYVAVIVNKGRSAAGAFEVDLLRAGNAVGNETVPALAPGATTTVVVPGIPCASGEDVQAIVDPLSDVDESNEENNSLDTPC
jgi:hypothetical protein